MEKSNNWRSEKFGNYLKLASGSTKPTDLNGIVTKETPYPVFGGNGVMGYSASFNVEGQQIIIGRVGEKCGCVHFFDGRAWITDNALYSRDILSEIDNEFLFYRLRYANLSRLRNKGSQPLVSQKPIYNLDFLLPPPDEQKAVAQRIKCYGKVIISLEALIETKREHKRALMQRLLTGKLRLPEFAGSEWKKAHIDELLKQVKRPVQWDDNAEYRLISVRRRSGGLFVREVLRGDQILTKKMNTAKAGDFLISKMQVVHGAMGLTTAEFDGMNISDSYIALVARDPNVLDMEYFDWLSRSRDMYHRAYRSSYGVHIEKMTFNLDLFLTEKISFPSNIAEQRKIATVLSAADREIDQLIQKLDAYKQQKKGLMQQLLTGKKRVGIAKSEVA
jgi:type I restriction enzyme S subunit